MTSRLAALVAVVLLGVAPSLRAQEPLRQPAQGWTRVRVAKWALLGVSAGFGLYALEHTRSAQHAYEALTRRCQGEPDRCALVGGRYADASTEALFQRSGREDRRAQLGIIGGQVTLFGSAALFIYDLRNGHGPQNIPYPARLTTPARALVVGVRLGR